MKHLKNTTPDRPAIAGEYFTPKLDPEFLHGKLIVFMQSHELEMFQLYALVTFIQESEKWKNLVACNHLFRFLIQTDFFHQLAPEYLEELLAIYRFIERMNDRTPERWSPHL